MTYRLVRSMPSSKLEMAWTRRHRSAIFLPNADESLLDALSARRPTASKMLRCDRQPHLFCTSRIPPFEPDVTTLTPASFLSVSIALPFLPTFSPSFPFATPLLPSAMYRMLSCTTAFRKDSFANSFTSTTSGAYGDRPLNANRAVTIAFAAAPKSAFRSTMATERADDGETRVLADGSPPFCSTETTVESKKD